MHPATTLPRTATVFSAPGLRNARREKRPQFSGVLVTDTKIQAYRNPGVTTDESQHLFPWMRDQVLQLSNIFKTGNPKTRIIITNPDSAKVYTAEINEIFQNQATMPLGTKAPNTAQTEQDILEEAAMQMLMASLLQLESAILDGAGRQIKEKVFELLRVMRMHNERFNIDTKAVKEWMNNLRKVNPDDFKPNREGIMTLDLQA